MSKLKQINDESYSLHLSLVATGNNIVADSISLNLRPRFSHISRQDLIQSAIANAKNGDVFRDIKASFDTSGEEGVSDILIAKALRLRLLKEKEEFIASKLVSFDHTFKLLDILKIGSSCSCSRSSYFRTRCQEIIACGKKGSCGSKSRKKATS